MAQSEFRATAQWACESLYHLREHMCPDSKSLTKRKAEAERVVASLTTGSRATQEWAGAGEGPPGASLISAEPKQSERQPST